jgi:uncharacterized protein YfaS (alpha-2-macroglobulin family)
MYSKLLMLILVCGLATLLIAEPNETLDYNSAWKEIDKLQWGRLPKSMETKVDSLYNVAVQENRVDQQIKALIYKLTILQQIQEFSTQKAIDLVQTQLTGASVPAAAIMHSMLAQLYWGYYQENRWKYNQRSSTINFKQDDIATWDLDAITKETIRQNRLALQYPEQLQRYSIVEYRVLLSGYDNEQMLLRPTLYDLLAHRSLDFFKCDESGLTLPLEEFSITDAKYFQPSDGFVDMIVSTPDSLSLKYQAILLFQDIIRFHLNDADPTALVEVDLERLEFVYKIFNMNNPEQLYEDALRNLLTRYANLPVSAYASYKLANHLYKQGFLYDPSISEAYRWNFKLAESICKAAREAYPESYGANCCTILLQNICIPDLSMETEQFVLPGASQKALLKLRNLNDVKLKIYKIPYPDVREMQKHYYSFMVDNYQKVRTMMEKSPLWNHVFGVEAESDFRDHSYEIPLPKLPAGCYIIIASNDMANPTDKADDIIGYSLFSVKELACLFPDDTRETIRVVNSRTGSPISGATVMVYAIKDRQDYHTTARFDIAWSGTSDAEGSLTLPSLGGYYSIRLQIVNKADTLIIYDYSRSEVYKPYTKSRVLLFTDRAIYRPGQNIHVKGVYYRSNGEKHYELLKNQNIRVALYDVNRQMIAKYDLRTNEFATFNCIFTAPQGVLTGNMTIYAGEEGSVSISVEEYKRPSFEVIIDKPKDSYKLNQNVTVKGKALSYAGVPVDNASISYRISRQPKYPYWYWWWGASPETAQKEISNGKAVTDGKGEFSLSFLAYADESVLLKYNPYFTYSITVDVTDINGETHSGMLTLNVGEKELILNTELDDNIDSAKQMLSVPIHSSNLSNEPIAVQGTIKVMQLQSPTSIQRKRLWNAPDRNFLERSEYRTLFPNDAYGDEDDMLTWKVLRTVHSGSFDTASKKPYVISNLCTWKPGKYLLEITTRYNEQEIKHSRYITVYNSVSANLPYPMTDLLIPRKTVCEPGENAEILIGSSYNNVSVLYEVERNHSIVESKYITLSRELQLITIPVKEQDRGCFYVHLSFVKDNRLYTYVQEITVPWTNKQLSIEYMSFRNKLLPGQEEEWRLKLKDHTGGGVTAEVLASMYDASLDAFRSGQWYSSVYGKVSRSCGWYSSGLGNHESLVTFQGLYYGMSERIRSYAYLQWFGYRVPYYCYNDARPLNFPSNKPTTVQRKIVGSSKQVVLAAMEDGAAMVTPQYDKAYSQPLPQENLSSVQPRTNFAETAFFYPELRTDENGEVSFIFTVPEALTRWKFRALALTKDFQIGTTENTAVTQKPLMVVPNAPRFFREGDTISFSSKISCLDDADQSGFCQLFLFDALSMQPVDASFGLRNAQQPFSVKQGESTVLSWNLTIPYDLSAVTYRVVAKAGDFSDGEENTLPILSNRMLVTESLPLPVSGNSTKTFELTKLKNSVKSSTIKNHRLTLEYTSNPAWYAVQALPYMMEYPYECNEQIFSRFYANSMASHIANSNPRIKRVFESWRDTPNSTALLSNLEKNQELKAVLLQETPWVLDAKNESQSKQRIGLLFDLNNMANQLNLSITKLKRNQSPSGAWPWYDGMDDSWWITQYIVEGFGHLDKLGVSAIRKDSKVWAMVLPAIRYIDQQILKDYEYLKQHGFLGRDNLGYMEMHYLYARSFFKDIALSNDVKEAAQYFTDQAATHWQVKDNFGQGLIALSLHRDGNTLIPARIIASLKERALHNEEMGMWWKSNYGWYWYQAPIETQALMIEVFNDISGDTASVDEMRTWLLKQKQTTNWKTTKATAEACYALLISGTEWLNTDLLAEISIGGKKLDPGTLDGVAVEAGTGYFKTSWSGNDISSKMADVTVKNPNRVSSWGSLYWQYFEDMDKITPADTPLKLNKKLFIERITDTGKVLEPVSDNAILQVGDKVVVRIELRSDRDMEYVHMKDMRSAGFEPINVLSRTKRQDGLVYYEATGDAATNFFIEYLRKGTYVFEYPMWVTHKGNFANGITSIQCMYAPEFTAHSEGIRVLVR